MRRQAHSENRALKEEVQNLQKILKDVFETGTAAQDDSNPMKSSSRESNASKYSSFSTDVGQGRKRDLSLPVSKKNNPLSGKSQDLKVRNGFNGHSLATKQHLILSLVPFVHSSLPVLKMSSIVSSRNFSEQLMTFVISILGIEILQMPLKNEMQTLIHYSHAYGWNF